MGKGTLIETANSYPVFYSHPLSKAGIRLVEMLEEQGVPVITPFNFYHLVWEMYATSKGKRLYLRHAKPTEKDYDRHRLNLKRHRVIGPDRDYGNRLIRILSVPDLPAENIVCIADPTCHVSHMSAMQRWGLTDRSPAALLITRPDRQSAKAILQEIMAKTLEEGETTPLPLQRPTHPTKVRRREISVFETKASGIFIKDRRNHIHISSIGQTFLDMLRKPELCGGMAHILDVWENHATTYADQIIQAIDEAEGNLLKSRAGYILEERMKMKDSRIEAWKALGQRGSSRKLDPSKPFAPVYSETWMISLNV